MRSLVALGSVCALLVSCAPAAPARSRRTYAPLPSSVIDAPEPSGSTKVAPEPAPLPSPARSTIRLIFGVPLDGAAIDALEAALGAPLEETMLPYLKPFEPSEIDDWRIGPEKGNYQAVVKEIRSRLPGAAAQLDELLRQPARLLAADLALARDAYDETRLSGDALSVNERRAALFRTFNEGIARLRAAAAAAMPKLLFDDIVPLPWFLSLERTADALLKKVVLERTRVDEILRAAVRHHISRRLTEMFAAPEIDAALARLRPHFARYLTIK